MTPADPPATVCSCGHPIGPHGVEGCFAAAGCDCPGLLLCERYPESFSAEHRASHETTAYPLFSPDAEHCHNCGEAVGVVWTAPDDLWMAIQGRPGGILCVQCFDDKAAAQGRFIRWVPQQEGRSRFANLGPKTDDELDDPGKTENKGASPSWIERLLLGVFR